jgi:hypothetical protein
MEIVDILKSYDDAVECIARARITLSEKSGNPVWEKLYRITNYIQQQQKQIFSEVFGDPEARQ